jgi:hypothetical protein
MLEIDGAASPPYCRDRSAFARAPTHTHTQLFSLHRCSFSGVDVVPAPWPLPLLQEKDFNKEVTTTIEGSWG